MSFKKAVRKRVRARILLAGPTGSGKTWTILALAQALSKHSNSKVAVIDTERESASIYADRYDFDVKELETFSVKEYIDAINEAVEGGYGILVIDSLSHAWAGKGGVLEAVDKAAKRMKNPNSYMAWREGTTLQEDLVEAILRYPGDVLVTVRSKMDYVQDKNSDGKTVIKKVGMAPVQREGLEYEFTIVGEMDLDHNLIVTKSRCPELSDQVFPKAGKNFFDPLIAWLDGGAAIAEDAEKETAAKEEHDKLVNKVRIGLGIAEKEGLGGLDVARHRANWLKKWLKVEQIDNIVNATTEDLQAALDDLTEKARLTYAEQAHTLQDFLTTDNTDEAMILSLADLRSKTLRKPLSGESTNDIDEASPHTLKKYIEALNALKKEKAVA